ncbi:NAD-dependent epimerase/dehydratase family protein [Shewanella sp. A32]|uniref:NAD-dependent epimerase/dehydratase family protein n=1 Tax=Shewanella sp. A32 TaxID=3031327 RepID=UPI0023B8A99D|nr:NAD-dependent epimerase/dehydratase family protein [Shewanella sp. A32]MDF0534867.1 NAD-dependent epimerase/dehydratase family protein [Shewanella sp. A32]
MQVLLTGGAGDIGTQTGEALRQTGEKKWVWEAPSIIYGAPHKVPIIEDFLLAPTNPYGCRKLKVEQIISDRCAATRAGSGFNGIILRYFGPVVAHSRRLVDEDAHGSLNNLMPFIAAGRHHKPSVFSDDYPTAVSNGVGAATNDSGCDLPACVVGRRTGDVVQCYANARLGREQRGLQTTRNLTEMVVSSWRWQPANSDGYRSTIV